MAIRKILRIGDPLLRKVSEPVPESELGSKEIKKLIQDMHETMLQANGLGLAAPQVGVLKRLIVVGYDENNRYPGVNEKQKRQVIINPEIKILDKKTVGFWEGCLSVPEMSGYVERSRRIRMKWSNESGEQFDEVIEGFQAVVYQHEYDHLNGVVYVDRIQDIRLFGFNDELDAAREQKSESSSNPV